MRAKPTSNTRNSGKSHRPNAKPHVANHKGVFKKNRESEKKVIPDLSILRQPVDTSINGLKQAVKVFETGTPEVLHLLTYDCDVVYECKICRNLFRSIANFISHKRIYCTERYSRSQELRSTKEGDDYTLILGEKATERLPTRITARKDLTSIVESLAGPNCVSQFSPTQPEEKSPCNSDKKSTTVHLEPMENTTYGVFQTVLKPDSKELMKNQVTELQNLISQNEVILGPDGRILENGIAYLPEEEKEEPANNEGNICVICNTKFANKKTLAKHKKLMHEAVRSSYSCPCCKNYFANPWSVYRHLYKVHRKTNEQVRRLRSQIHKKDIKVEKATASSVNIKKVVSPNKKKGDSEIHQKIRQDNKEWMDHFEDNWELQRCGGCGRKFERKAALISHSQICQKRIAACNRIEHKQLVQPVSLTPIVAVSHIPCSKKPIPKPSPEKKIGIQVRMNYCKNNSSASSQIRPRSVLGDESDVEAVSVDGKDSFFNHSPMKHSMEIKGSCVIEQLLKSASKCSADGVSKVESYLNSTTNTVEKVNTYEISTFKRSTFLRSNINKSKSLEAKCLQLRSALENELTDTLSKGQKDTYDHGRYSDGNVDNISESNSSIVSSLSSQLTPLVDKRYVSEVEQIEINNINISTELEKIPSTEADSTSMSNIGNLKIAYNSDTYTENIKFSPSGDATCEEVSTSFTLFDIPQGDCQMSVDSSCMNDDEISTDLKPISYEPSETNESFRECELENTISILTRNQLKAICKDDLLPTNDVDNKKVSTINGSKRNGTDAEVESATRDMIKKRLYRYANTSKNTCSICDRKFKKLRDIYRHIPTHTRWKRYECLYNGCTFQTFMKKTCLHHVTLHTKEGRGETAETLVGVINPSKWNLKLVENLPQSKTVSKANVIHRKKVSSEKIVKPVVIISKKTRKPTLIQKIKLKAQIDNSNGKRKVKLTKLLAKSPSKQKLLTEFKHFSRENAKHLQGRSLTRGQRVKDESPESSKGSVNGLSPKRLKPRIIVENGNPNKMLQVLRTSGRPSKTSNPEFNGKTKFSMDKKEPREDEIVVNHITVDSNEPSSIKGRGSRASSMKSSVNSIDQQKGKNLNNSVRAEDSNVHHLASATSNDLQQSFHILNSEIVDGSSSLEEEESQESDRTVDDSHLKKIFMEVIFGPTAPSTGQAPGRPVRNKSRPKRDSDFFLGGEKDISEGKTSISKKINKTPTESKPLQEALRKSK